MMDSVVLGLYHSFFTFLLLFGFTLNEEKGAVSGRFFFFSCLLLCLL